jgi:hypothetical protein
MSMCVLSPKERNLGREIRPFPRFTVDRRCASEQLESSASSALSEAAGRSPVEFEAGSPIPGVNTEYVSIQGQLQEYPSALAVAAGVGERLLRDADGRSFPLRRDICVDGVLAEFHVGTVRGLDFLNQVRHRRGKTARRKQDRLKIADRPPQFLDCLVEEPHRRVEAVPIQAGFRLLATKGFQSCSSRNRVLTSDVLSFVSHILLLFRLLADFAIGLLRLKAGCWMIGLVLARAPIPHLFAIHPDRPGSLDLQSHHSSPDAIDDNANVPVDHHRLAGFPR